MIEQIPLLFSQFGLIGLFIASFLGSTIFFPFTSEILIPLFLLYLKNLYFVVLALTVGSTLGTCVNYYLGFLGEKTIEKHVGKDKIFKAREFMNRYGWSGLLLILTIPIPGLPVDPITIIPGLTKMRFKEFLAVVFVGKLIKYALFVGLFNGLMQVLIQ